MISGLPTKEEMCEELITESPEQIQSSAQTEVQNKLYCAQAGSRSNNQGNQVEMAELTLIYQPGSEHQESELKREYKTSQHIKGCPCVTTPDSSRGVEAARG